MEQRYYFDDSGATILSEVFLYGESSGWCGSLERLEEMKRDLEEFNVKYVDDFTGTWRLA